MKFSKRMTTVTALLSFVILLVIAGNATAATITVPDDYSTIQAAINAANPGDTVYVKAGTYAETLTINKAITLQGAGKNVVNLDSSSGTAIDIQADNVTIKGFNISATSYGIDLNDNGWITIMDNRFSGVKTGVYGYYNGYGTEEGDIIISNNIFEPVSTWWYAIDLNYDLDDDEYVINWGNIIVTDNVFEGRNGALSIYYEVEYIFYDSLVRTGDIYFTNNTVNSFGSDGVYIYYDYNDEIEDDSRITYGDVYIIGNTFEDPNSAEYAIYIDYYTEDMWDYASITFGKVVITDNYIDGNDELDDGIYFYYDLDGYLEEDSSLTVGPVKIQDNEIYDIYDDAITLNYDGYIEDIYDDSHLTIGNVIISGNTVDGADDGVYLDYYIDYIEDDAVVSIGKVTIQDNTFLNLDGDGIYVEYDDVDEIDDYAQLTIGPLVIENNTIESYYGIEIYYDYVEYVYYYANVTFGDVTISGNTISVDGDAEGIYIEYYDISDIEDDANVTFGALYIKDNTINWADTGLEIYYDYLDEIYYNANITFKDRVIEGNTFNELDNGIYVYYDEWGYYGDIEDEATVTLGTFEVKNNDFSNIDREAIYIGYDDVNNDDYSVIQAGDTIVEGNTFTDVSYEAIYIYESDYVGYEYIGDVLDLGDIYIRYNTMTDVGTDGDDAIYVDIDSYDITREPDVFIYGNTITNPTNPYCYTGINVYGYYANATYIYNNMISGVDGTGIILYRSDYTEIHDNVIVNITDYGIYINGVYEGRIYENTIQNSGDYALYLGSNAEDFYIYRNNFLVDSSYEPYDDGTSNQWWSDSQITYFYNDTSWTNYTGNYYQWYSDTDSNGDGIWDSPYSGSTFDDDYPLAFPWEAGNLSVGSDVNFTALTAQGPVEVTFDNVNSPGVATVDAIDPAQAPNLPNGFLFLDIKATAGYTGYIYITVYYNESQLPSGLNENTMKLYHYKNGAWHDITYSRDTVNNTITGRTTSLSVFGIGLIPSRVGAPAFLTPGKFFKSDQIGLRQRVPVNETATFGIYLKNLDDQLNTINITYSIDKETPGDLTIEVPESITLEPLEEKQININITPNEKGSFIIHFKAESAGAEYVSYDFVFVVDAF